MNKVILIGRFTRDPELRTSQSGVASVRFSLACDNDYVDRNGERGVEFINCVAFNRNAETIGRYCTKGRLISVEGSIRNSSYEQQDGTKRYNTDVVVSNFTFLSGGSSNSNSNNNTNNQNNNFMNDNVSENASVNMPTADMEDDPFKSFGDEITYSENDLPF